MEKLKPVLNKIFTAVKSFAKKVLTAILTVGYFLYKKISRLLEHLPIPASFRRMSAMIILSLALVAVIIVCIPLAKTVTDVAGNVVETIVDKTPDTSSTISQPSSFIDPYNEDPPILQEPLPEQMEVPQNDIINIPTGGSAWRFSQDELNALTQLMTYTEKCESFTFNDADKDAMMALTAYRLLIETNDVNMSLNTSPRYYTIHSLHLNKYINSLFGRNLSSTDKLGNILFDNNRYMYFNEVIEPLAVSAYITDAYTLGDNFYKINGIVTRGFPNEAGCYSRRISIVLLKHKDAGFGYYIMSVVNEPMSYTYLDSLQNSPFLESSKIHLIQYSKPNNADSSTSESDVSGNDSTSSAESDVSSSDGETSSTVSNEPATSVAQPDTQTGNKTSLNREEKEKLKSLCNLVPISLADLDVSDPVSEQLRMLTAHIQLCKDNNVDYTTQITMNTYADINAKAKALFGNEIESITADMSGEMYIIDPFVTTGKSEFDFKAAYDMGNDSYTILYEVDYYSNTLLEKPDGKYQYSILVKKDSTARFGYYLKLQKYIAEE